jgi:predicted nucleic acid-binding protein
MLIFELSRQYNENEINSTVLPFQKVLIVSSELQKKEAKTIAKQRNIPEGDALHAVLARDSDAILITRDRHFLLLIDICLSRKPEELL